MDCLRIKEGQRIPMKASRMQGDRANDINLVELDLREDFRERRPQPKGELIKIRVNSRENDFLQIGAHLPEEL